MTHDLQHKIENIISRNQQADDKDVLFQLKQLFYEAEWPQNADGEAKKITDLVTESIHMLGDEAQHAGVIPSGFVDFDRQFGGFRLGELVIIGGRPAMGKTQFLVSLALQMSTVVPVLYASYDLSELMLTSRMLSTVSGIPTKDLLQNTLSVAQKKCLSGIEDKFAGRELFVYDNVNTSIVALKARCQKQIQEKGVQVIIVDYLQLLSSHNHRKFRELEVSFISRELKNLARDNNVCVIASSQLSRAVAYRSGHEGKRPQLSDLRESGAIEQDADKVLFIHRPEYYGISEDNMGNNLRNVVEIIVAKNRNGPLGEFILLRDNDFTKLEPFNGFKNEIVFLPERLQELDKQPFDLDDPPF